MHFVITDQSENVIVVQLVFTCFGSDTLLQCYHWGWTHMAVEQKLPALHTDIEHHHILQ